MAQKYFGSNIPVAAGFDLAAQRPLDAREVVAKYSDLATIPDIQKYAGLKVYVEEQKKYHFWDGSTWQAEVNQGGAGPAGSDGATWLSGSAAPSGQGKDGDFYLNTSNYDIYKKESGTWNKIGNIKGATGQTGSNGQDGIDGATWLFGTSAPSSQGKDGDFYLNTSTFDVYNKASGTWSKKGNIKGATGTRGSQWFSGTAITGTNAEGTVFSGSGVTSALVNDMYLNTSTGAVYKCTTAGNATTAKWAYVGSIKGATGATGTPGEDGADGAPGEDGATWLFGTAAPTDQGKDGDFFLNTSTFDIYNKASGTWSKKGNIKGATGATGTPGKDGTDGAPGTDGEDGATWLSGAGAPSSQGKTGDFYLDTSTFDVYSKATGSWVKSVNIKGAKGDKGEKGETGEGFSVYKTYTSVSAMNADKANVAQGKFVLIASDVEDEDNAKLYVKGASDFTFLTDLSGAQGIKGEKGEKGDPGQDGATGPAGKDGDNVRVGTEYATAKQVKLFFKVVE